MAAGNKVEEVVEEGEEQSKNATSSSSSSSVSTASVSESNDPLPVSKLKLTNDTECNSEELRAIITENLDDDLNSSKRLIQLAAEAKFGGRFDVICSSNDFSYVTNTELYCQETKQSVSCYAYRQL